MSKIVEFDGLSLEVEALLNPNGRQTKGPWPVDWTRMEIDIPDQYHSVNVIRDWIEENLKKPWGHYVYSKPESKPVRNSTGRGRYTRGQDRMVLCFKDKNDALMLRLLGGDKAWENADDNPF